MGIGSGSLDGNDVGKTLELNGKWECWYGSERGWELGTHSLSPPVHAESVWYFKIRL